jgi:methionine-S-sulfoxide reductase
MMRKETRISNIPLTSETAYFALGCFWSKEYAFSKLAGVTATRVGFAGGHTDAPTYKVVCTKTTGHAETVEVQYAPSQISYKKLLYYFFRWHNPSIDRRAKGGQYRSAIFYTTPAQLVTATRLIQRLTDQAYTIYTEVNPMTTFWPADERHQGYCEVRGITPTTRGQGIPEEAFGSEQ